MKKKIFLLILIIICVCGCSKVKKLSYDDIIGTFVINKGYANMYRTGYKYHLPKGMQSQDVSLFNEILTSNQGEYYLFVDMVSYYNKKEINYKINDSSIWSKNFSYNDSTGYVEINLKENNKYLVEIMYNYAKIEVMVDKKDIKETMLYAVSVLRSITYNDNVITNLLGEDILNYADEDYNIFNTTSEDSNYLNYDKEYKESDEKETYDSDLLN